LAACTDFLGQAISPTTKELGLLDAWISLSRNVRKYFPSYAA